MSSTTRIILSVFLSLLFLSVASGKEIKKETYTYKMAGSLPIRADVYSPGEGDQLPVVVWVHGGALIMGDRNSIPSDFLELLNRAGYVVVSIDYRLAPETKLPLIIEDLQDACRWVREQGPKLFHIDPKRFAVAGGSAGGYLTLMSGFCIDPPPVALVSFWGYGDIGGDWYIKPDPFYNRQPAVPKTEAYEAVSGPVLSEQGKKQRQRFYLYCRQNGLWTKEVAGLDPVVDAHALARFCPIRNVSAKYPPTFLVHGTKDTDVPYEQSATMDKELTRQGVPHEFITIQDGPHGLGGVDRAIVAQMHQRVLRFLGERLGNPITTDPSTPNAFKFFQPVVPPRPFQVVAHQGMTRQAPVNTRRTIELAIQDGMEWVELDVRRTKDAKHVIFDDGRLDGRSSGSGNVKDHTLDELRQLDAGSWFAKRYAGAKIMSLPECLELAKDKINLCLGCEDIDPDALVREIRDAGMQQQAIVSGSIETLRRVRELSNGKIAIMPRWRSELALDKWLDELRPDVVEIDADQITPGICRALRDRGIRVQATLVGSWDQPKFWEKAVSDGAEYLQTDLAEEVVAHMTNARIKQRPVRMSLHRGANRYAPENTLPAFEKAFRLHTDFVEFDVRPSRDGKFYLLHDSGLDRTTTGHGPIKMSDSATIDGLGAGTWFGKDFAGVRVPTLEQFLAAIPEGISLYFDAKDIPPEALAQAVARHGLVERTVVYQGAAYLEKLKQIDPRIRALPGIGSVADVDRLAAGLKPYAVDSPWTLLSKEYIAHCHSLGIQVFADAHDDVNVANYRRAIVWGIDLIQTDHPLSVWRAMELVAAERHQLVK